MKTFIIIIILTLVSFALYAKWNILAFTLLFLLLFYSFSRIIKNLKTKDKVRRSLIEEEARRKVFENPEQQAMDAELFKARPITPMPEDLAKFIRESDQRYKEQARKHLFLCAEKIAHQHEATLVRKKIQGVITDEYKRQDDSKWKNDFRYFCDHILREDPSFAEALNTFLALTKNDDIDHEQIHREIYSHIETKIESANLKTSLPYHTGQDYELFCKAELLNSDWIVQTTPHTGDQGVDLVAEKDGVRVAIQCKFYSSPIGNAAVQQVIAGKLFYHATHAAVVSNTTYTAAAQQLAARSNVLLLQHDQLANLSQLISKPN